MFTPTKCLASAPLPASYSSGQLSRARRAVRSARRRCARSLEPHARRARKIEFSKELEDTVALRRNSVSPWPFPALPGDLLFQGHRKLWQEIALIGRDQAVGLIGERGQR